MSADRKTTGSVNLAGVSSQVSATPTRIGKGQRGKAGAKTSEPTTFFAPARRAAQEDLETTIQLVTQSPLTSALLRSATSMMCILNEHRQIVALNTSYLDTLELAHADDVIGLRPGEAMRCVHANDHPSGCGTGPFCRICEAAIALVASQTTGRAVERECVISVKNRKGEVRDLSLSVRASPFILNGEHFTVYCMTDVGEHLLFEGLQRTLLHDLSNLVCALAASSDGLRHAHIDNHAGLVDDICELTQRLSHDILVQRLLLSSDPVKQQLNFQDTNIGALLRFLERMMANHPSSRLKQLTIVTYPKVSEVRTVSSLLERVLINMLINAFEATEVGGTVRLGIESTDVALRFVVWNRGEITAQVVPRIFQRYFSTKSGPGRGQGTYAMRLLGETLLRGRVGFATSAEQGTTFYLELPLDPQAALR